MSTISSAPDRPIVIETTKVGGLGDISICFKIASALVLRGIPKEKIVISLEDTKDGALFNREGFSVISHEDKAKIPSVALQIFFAAIKGYVYPDAPILRIEEYDADPHTQEIRKEEGAKAYGDRFHYVALGLGGLGIFLDSELKRFAKAYPEPSYEHLLPLASLTPSLKEMLLGRDPDIERSLNGFLITRRLYVGHVSCFKTAFSFFKAIAQLNEGF